MRSAIVIPDVVDLKKIRFWYVVVPNSAVLMYYS